MKEESLFKQMQFVRKRTLAALDATTEEIADTQPEGFLNNIRWNLGHILVSQENLLNRFVGEEPSLPDGYDALFNSGTNPNEWPKNVPSLEEMRPHLAAQPDQLIGKYKGRLDEKTANSFNLGGGFEFTTLDEILNFTIWHEGIHQGTISSLKRAQKVEELF